MSRRRTLESAARRARVVEMRRDRATFDVIAAEMGVSKQRAHALYVEALHEVPAARVEQHRAEELDLIDRATRELLTLATDGDVSPRTRVEAYNAVRGWAERKARLLGLDAPAQVRAQVITDDMVDAAIEDLTRELEHQARCDARQEFGLPGDEERRPGA